MGAYRSITQPPAIRGPVRTPKKSQLVMWKLEIKSGNQCAHAPRCARLCCAVSSATGVRNKVRFLHGHHKFPNALQLIAHAAEKKRRDGMRRGGGGRRVLSKVFTRRVTPARRARERSETKELQKSTPFLSFSSALVWRLLASPPAERERKLFYTETERKERCVPRPCTRQQG